MAEPRRTCSRGLAGVPEGTSGDRRCVPPGCVQPCLGVRVETIPNHHRQLLSSLSTAAPMPGAELPGGQARGRSGKAGQGYVAGQVWLFPQGKAVTSEVPAGRQDQVSCRRSWLGVGGRIWSPASRGTGDEEGRFLHQSQEQGRSWSSPGGGVGWQGGQSHLTGEH